MQKPETGLLDTQKEAEKPKITKIIEISVDEQKRVYVNWPADKKELTIIALAEAIKLVETYQKPVIVQPRRPTFLEGTRNFLMGRKT